MEYIVSNDRIVYQNEEQILAEVTFPEEKEGVVNINHTFVDVSLRGQGIAGELLLRTADFLRASGKKAVPSCSYAQKWFSQHPEYRDVLYEPSR